MDKKTFIVKLLDSFQDWPMAQWLKYLIENGNLDDNTINVLIDMFKQAIKTVDDEKTKEKLTKWVTFLEKMKKMEEEQKLQDQKDIQNLEGILSTM